MEDGSGGARGVGTDRDKGWDDDPVRGRCPFGSYG